MQTINLLTSDRCRGGSLKVHHGGARGGEPLRLLHCDKPASKANSDFIIPDYFHNLIKRNANICRYKKKKRIPDSNNNRQVLHEWCSTVDDFKLKGL